MGGFQDHVREASRVEIAELQYLDAPHSHLGLALHETVSNEEKGDKSLKESEYENNYFLYFTTVSLK